VEPLDSTTFSTFLKKTCNIDLLAASITKLSSFRNKAGQTVVRATIPNHAEKVAIFKHKKNLAEKKIYVSEALTSAKFQLLMAAKGLCKNKQIFSSWSNGGKIFIKKEAEGTPHLVKNKQELDSLAI